MSRAKELLAERLQYHLADVIGGDPDWEDFAGRIADEIGLPDYEAAVSALQNMLVVNEGLELNGAEEAREALARLREGEAAHVR